MVSFNCDWYCISASLVNNEASDKGALKLYIGTNPAIGTYKFYQSVGCILATEIISEVYNHEPLDLQLE